MREYLIENIEAVPSSKWFLEDVDEQVVEFFYFKLLIATLIHPSTRIFSVVPEQGRKLLLRIDDGESFTFVRKDSMYEEGVIDYGKITAHSNADGRMLFFAEGEFMERYRFFCTETQPQQH